MTPWFADSVFYFALLSESDEYHDIAVVHSRAERRMVTTQAILTEVADGLAGAHERDRVVKLVNALLASPAVTVVPASASLFERGMELYRSRPDKEWSLTDCMSFVIMHEHGLTEALTADHHFEQAGFAALLRA